VSNLKYHVCYRQVYNWIQVIISHNHTYYTVLQVLFKKFIGDPTFGQLSMVLSLVGKYVGCIGVKLATIVIGVKLATMVIGVKLAIMVIGVKLATMVIGVKLATICIGVKLAPMFIGSHGVPSLGI
jgi:hypothetical protein